MLHIAPLPQLHALAAQLANDAHHRAADKTNFLIALPGGNTPQAWFAAIVRENLLAPCLLAGAHFTTSDERHVPSDSPQSNYGNAVRYLLDPLKIPANRRHPWPTQLPPRQAAVAYEKTLPKKIPDICYLGIGADTHTASLFPGSPLLDKPPSGNYAAATAPDKSPRLTITPAGLAACPLIIILCPDASKAGALRTIFTTPVDIQVHPAQLLLTKEFSQKTHWLLSPESASQLPE